jgi:hypothetical protein
MQALVGVPSGTRVWVDAGVLPRHERRVSLLKTECSSGKLASDLSLDHF